MKKKDEVAANRDELRVHVDDLQSLIEKMDVVVNDLVEGTNLIESALDSLSEDV